MANVLLIDFGSTYTKITAIDVEREVILGTARGITTVETDIMEGLNQALDKLFATTGRLEFAKVLGCSSAAGGLKMVAIGLVPELTAEAAKRAALGAGAKVLGVYCHELSDYELEEIVGLKPEIILLAGGTDGGNKEVILHNAKMLAASGLNVPVVVAGNKSVAPAVVKMLAATMTDVYHTENVMPRLNELNIEPARATIRDVFLKRIVEAKGLNKANKFVDRMVMPTPAAVLRAAELLSRGTDNEPGLGDLMVVDIGGATTDVYSIGKGEPSKPAVALRGLPEPFAKRTVEGDLGMRYSAGALLKAAGARLIGSYAETSEEAVVAYVAKVEANIEYLPQTAEEERIEIAMGRACTKLSADRHVGQLETYFTPFGSTFVQTGKDLTGVTTVVGTGGVIINNPHPEAILRGIVFEEANPHILKPQQPEFLIDRQYIMAAMGLLGEDYPDTAVRMLKKYIVRRDSHGTEK
ncbi:methylaspartate mutase accessory protein GlmL [Sporolituus thermophilus]|uniref:MutL protein n=1 Tax=Sporolituus thermophilus DSM 23256 TaxID=1123285 RepID=A0A1G7K4H1_9FIRM|nr:methylaspartate mutase accessory protein GlmL [Sporolituus thermophilus]SDF32143.1 conserved hypothetical protein [Sporolituus thermophilus DSM 23256]